MMAAWLPGINARRGETGGSVLPAKSKPLDRRATFLAGLMKESRWVECGVGSGSGWMPRGAVSDPALSGIMSLVNSGYLNLFCGTHSKPEVR